MHVFVSLMPSVAATVFRASFSLFLSLLITFFFYFYFFYVFLEFAVILARGSE